MATIGVDLKVVTWQRIEIPIPEGMTAEEFVQHIKETDPRCSGLENNGIEYLEDTETTLRAEYFNENGDFIDRWEAEKETE